MFNSRTMHTRAACAAVVAFGLLAVGCDTAKTSSKAKTNSTTTNSSATAPGDIMKDSQAAVDLAYAGNCGNPAKSSHSSPGRMPIASRRPSICAVVIWPAWLSLCPASGVPQPLTV